jgi:hypothetical protein
MGLDIDAWLHLTPYVGPPCANTHICQMAPEYQTALIPPARALGHIRLHTGPKTADEIRKEFGLEPGICYQGAEHYEFKLGYIEYADWLVWLGGWNPEAFELLDGIQEDDNTVGPRVAQELLEALNPARFEATFGDAEIEFGEDENGVYPDAGSAYRDFVKACGLAAQDGLLAFR